MFSQYNSYSQVEPLDQEKLENFVNADYLTADL